MSESPEVLLELIDVHCRRHDACLDLVALSILPEAAYILRGDAGAGSLLRLLTLLDAPDSGEVRIAGRPMDALDEAARGSLRSRLFGFVFNAPYLLPELSVAENIAMPLFKVLDLDATEARGRTEAALAFAGLESVGGEAAGSLSRFDQQRVALARAVAHQPAVLVLDHADHHLAEEERRQLVDLARRARRELGLTLLIQSEYPITPAGDERVLIVENRLVREEGAVTAMSSEQAQ